MIVTTDHGHMLGEHGIVGKPSSNISDSNLYQELAHIPLLVLVPDAGHQRRQELVQPVDLFATLLDVVGLPVPEHVHGQSLLPLARGTAGAWSRQFAWWGRFGEAISITDGDRVLFKWPEGASNEPLYWYSPTPPLYAKFFSSVGPDEGGRYRVTVARGDQYTALFDLRTDPGQEHDLSAEAPEQVRCLSRALADRLREVGAPAEQLTRLELDKLES